jgi:amino acid adenylation domain-containing protein
MSRNKSILSGPYRAYLEEPAHKLFDIQSIRNPNGTALIQASQRVSYENLKRQADAVALGLRNCGAFNGAIVGVFIRRSIPAIVSILGILKAGAAYVALDPDLPAERLRQMIGDAGLTIIVTDMELRTKLPPIEGVSTIPLGELAQDLREPVQPDDATVDGLAYVSYTSGSTGLPKGVMHTHRQLVHRVGTLAPDEVSCLNVSLSFSFSLSRIFPPLLSGRPLVIVSDGEHEDAAKLLNTIDSENITSIALVPSALRQILEWIIRRPTLGRSLRSVTVAGASLSEDLVRLFFRALPNSKLLYGYGASETGPVTLKEVGPSSDFSHRLVGWPQANISVLIVDEHGVPVPHGDVGEVCVQAQHVALGYLRRPELTKERFDGVGPKQVPTFRTGDFAQIAPDGQIQLNGRVDHQVKVRGYRVELGDIDAALALHPAIVEAATVADSTGEETTLVSYVVLLEEQTIKPSELRGHLQNLIPVYMVPLQFVQLPSFPLTLTGKVDRGAFPPPPPRSRSIDYLFEPPRTALEQAVAEIWRDVLGIPQIGVRDNLLELGDSLSITQAVASIWDKLGVEIPLLTVFEKPSISDLAKEVALLLEQTANMARESRHGDR